MTQEDSKQISPDPDGLKTALKQGRRLSIQLRPNHQALATEDPEYDEAYALPFVFCEGEAIAGLTRTGHFLADDKGGYETISFSYNTAYPYYSIHFPNRYDRVKNQIATKIMSKLQYQVFDFKLTDPARLIFETDAADGHKPRDHGLSDSIKAGRTHFLTIGFEGGRMWSLPVDISYDYYPTGAIEFRTETLLTSKHVVMPESFHAELAATNGQVIDAMKHPSANLELFMPADITFLKILADGRFHTAATLGANKPMHYDFLKVFEYP